MSNDIAWGYIDVVILSMLAEKDRYGYEISKDISDRTDNKFNIKESTLYSVLQRFQRQGLVEPYYNNFSHGGKRRYFKITPVGRVYLNNEIYKWKSIEALMNIFLGGLE